MKRLGHSLHLKKKMLSTAAFSPRQFVLKNVSEMLELKIYQSIFPSKQAASSWRTLQTLAASRRRRRQRRWGKDLGCGGGGGPSSL
jgi:hypothetical protein